MATAARRWRRVLRSPWRAADCGHHRIRSRGVVSRLRVLQAAQDAEEALARGIQVL